MNKLKQILIFFTIIFISFHLHAGASDDVKTNSEDFETSVLEDEIYDPLEGLIELYLVLIMLQIK